MRRHLLKLAAVLPLLWLHSAWAAITIEDDAHREVTLDAPARRIVSLAPHATELLFAAGAGPYVVGVSQYSDYPPQAARLASVGSSAALDVERIAMLKPDLVVAWRSGNSATQVAALRRLGIAVFESEPRDFDTIASSLERLAALAGTEAVGREAAQSFRFRLRTLEQTYRQRAPLRVFYQVWKAPLMTLNGEHLVSHVLQLCGGRNVFADLPQLTPMVGIEAVLQAKPEAIIGSGSQQDLGDWRRFPGLPAVTHGNLFTVHGDWLSRPGPRILDGTEEVCKKLDEARSRRK